MATGLMVVRQTQARTRTTAAAAAWCAQPILTAPLLAATVNAPQCATQAGRIATVTGRTAVRLM